MNGAFLFTFFLSFFFLSVPAGPRDFENQIGAISKEIVAAPGDAELFVVRADLYRMAGEFDLALKDYQKAQRTDSTLVLVHLGFGKLFFDEKRFPQALRSLDTFLTLRPHHPEGLLYRARTRMAVAKYLESAADFTELITAQNDSSPGNYLERAQAFAAAGPAHLPEALAGLEEGLRRLGPIITLQEYALRLETENGRYDEALRRIDDILSRMNRKEEWYCRKGEILLKAGRPAEADSAFTQSLKSIDGLPEGSRETRTMLKLRERVEAALRAAR